MIAINIGNADVFTRLVEGLKNESEPPRRMTTDARGMIAMTLGLSAIDSKLKERLVDRMFSVFQRVWRLRKQRFFTYPPCACVRVEKARHSRAPVLEAVDEYGSVENN